MSPLRLNGSTSGYAELAASATAGDVILTLPSTAGTLDRTNRAGNILQVVNTQTGSVTTGTGTIPTDNTIPQNTEGTEFMTLAITPTSSASKLLISINALLSANITGFWMSGALFQDSTANAIASTAQYQSANTGVVIITLNYYMTAGTTSSTTFKFRAGTSAAGTTTFNGSNGSGIHGGTVQSSMTIMEIAA